jgi:hypothetical protein
VNDRPAGSTDPVEIWTFGANRIPKAGGVGVAFSAGQRVLFDGVTGLAVEVAGPGTFFVGICTDLANADAHQSVGLLVLPFGQAIIEAAGALGVWSVVTETTATRAASSGEFILINASTCAITLPAAPASDDRVALKVIAATVTSVGIRTGAPGVEIDGTDYSAAPGLPMTAQFEQINVVSDGSAWWIY